LESGRREPHTSRRLLRSHCAQCNYRVFSVLWVKICSDTNVTERKHMRNEFSNSELLERLINALREELLEYGEMLARLDEEHGPAEDARMGARSLRPQNGNLRAKHRRRAEIERKLARHLGLPQSANLSEMIRLLPPNYKPLVRALLDETDELPIRLQQRRRDTLFGAATPHPMDKALLNSEVWG
jgi:hypothetical protein